MRVLRLAVGQMRANCYLVIDDKSRETVIIDPGDEAEYITDILTRENLKPLLILATHGHFDHIMGAWALQLAYKLSLLMNKKDEFLVSRMTATARHFLELKNIDFEPVIKQDIKDGDKINFGKSFLTVIETPGHTPGGLSFYSKKENLIFVGDLIFDEGYVGRTDFSYSNKASLKDSIKKILSLPGKTVVYSGHGEETSIKLLKEEISV